MNKTLLMLLATLLIDSAVAEQWSEPTEKSKGTVAWEREMSKNKMGLKSFYKETIKDHKLRVDVSKDFGMKRDQPDLDQSAKLQAAIDHVAQKGGGVVYIPKGEYRFKNVFLGSNVHIVVEESSVFRPVWSEGERKVHLLLFSHKVAKAEGEYIENCSIRATKGHYYVDFSDRPTSEFWGSRFIRVCMAKNFSIADFYLKDNFTTYCATIMTPSMVKGSHEWEINRPTDGQIINSVHVNSHPGYGLCQLHGARRVYFENIVGVGGVVLRLETGAALGYAGVFDIHARNVRSYDGYSALMMGPHISENGVVLADGLWSMGSCKTIGVSGGHTATLHKGKPYSSRGCFSDESKLINIHGVMGNNAQVSKKSAYCYDPSQYTLLGHEYNLFDRGKWLRGAALCVYMNALGGSYKVDVQGVTGEGYHNDLLIIDASKHKTDLEPQRFTFWKTIPHLAENAPASYVRESSAKKPAPKK